MGTPLDGAALDVIFRGARSQNKWLDEPVSDEQLQALYDLMRWGPTSANCFPLRTVFVKSPAAKERLQALVLAGNQPKVAAAPVTAILGYDTRFYEWLPRLFPHADARAWFIDKPEFAEATAFRNSSLQGAYFLIAARALGLDTGPMSGFDNEAVDR
jgi:3-hydroxypropanoate dehydrogenase